MGIIEDFIEFLFVKNGLYICVIINLSYLIGKDDFVGIVDVIVEVVMFVIMDCEDLVVCVDVEDKVFVYCNWLGFMKGDL